MLLTTLDLIGTFVFALSGGVRAVENRMDPFGVVFLSFVAAVTGGIMRDVLIGALPPVAMQSEAYVILAIIAGTTRWVTRKVPSRLKAQLRAPVRP